ncbi:venom carboxylesterase-6-like isoform X5 [Anoplophora glabripennis]|uniref:venom carboxylesterase-6-like isoform X5 n=1 Tax=Anoplophora glabripennis TaxID=217634 RepID=UPI000C79174D|nr:venom carboxylesterase-6-like isoform X5 [Anoplophora glabripennis]
MLPLLTTSRISNKFYIITTSVLIFADLFDNGNCLTFVKKEEYNRTLQVKTNNGFVQGFSRKMGNGKDIFIYQGIPFAKPPLYNLRFMSPQPQTKWAGVLDARQQTQPCVQLMFRTTPITVNGVEDCLYLNTYSPIKPRSNETVPVLYWIQGGSFLEGDVTIYDPEYFVEENVIVVTANYRLGMFGFLSTEDEAAPGNYALKDQNAVLRWIRSNIKGFGGDPNRVTILGQSAGACSVMYHMVSPKSIGLFHGAIAMSGNSLSPWCLQRYPRNVARDISLHLGLSIENSTAFVEALRKMDSQQLMYGQVVPILVNLAQIYHNGLAFTPVIEYNHKDAFVTESSYSLLEKGAGHAEDMVYLWKGLDMNRKERLVQNRLTKIWTNFIKYGNPTPIMDELLQNVTWPSITTPDSAIYLHIGESLTLRQDYRGSYKKFWADLFEKYCQKPFYIY